MIARTRSVCDRLRRLPRALVGTVGIVLVGAILWLVVLLMHYGILDEHS